MVNACTFALREAITLCTRSSFRSRINPEKSAKFRRVSNIYLRSEKIGACRALPVRLSFYTRNAMCREKITIITQTIRHNNIGVIDCTHCSGQCLRNNVYV